MIFGVEPIKRCIGKESLTILLLVKPQKLMSDHVLTFFLSSGCIFMADTLTLIPIGRPCDLLMFPDYKVSLEKGNLFLQFLPLIQGALMTLLLYIFISLGSFTSTFVTCAASGWQFVRIQQPVFKLLLVRSARSSL